MKPKLSLLAVLLLTVTLALVGVLRDVSTSKALIPDPVQPFLADASGGMADTTLGLVDINNYTITNIPRGSRTTLPWIYSGPGWGLEVDKNMTDETELLGTVFSYVDALCDSGGPADQDILQKLPCNTLVPPNPLIWRETTTAVEGTGSEYLKSLVPPYSWLARHTANITNICLYGTTEKSTTSILNTVYTNVPFAPNGSAFTATTKLGGDPVIPLSDTCLDSPQTSTSITSLYRAPAPEGDSDGPCNTTTYECADAAINGMWTDNTVVGSKTITVNKVLLNNGPEAGTFSEHWEVELTNPGIMGAVWVQTGTATIDESVALVKSVPTPQSKNLAITCTGTGEGLVVLKNVLWPTPPTKDTYADDNAFVFVTKVTCNNWTGLPVDKEVIWVKPLAVSDLTPSLPDWESTPSHLQLDLGQAITVTIDELKANHGGATPGAQIAGTCTVDMAAGTGLVSPITVAGAGCLAALTANSYFLLDNEVLQVVKAGNAPGANDVSVNRGAKASTIVNHANGTLLKSVTFQDEVNGHEWLVAEVADVANLGVEWDTGSVTIDQGGTPAPVAPVTACTTGDACIQYQVLEPFGQSDVIADLTITCGAVPGLYSVVLKAIDAPVATDGRDYSETKPSDNAQRSVIKVWCGAAARNPDGIEDANGLYARWTVFQSVGTSSLQIAAELRKSYKSPPSLVSDTGYVERLVDLQCFWLDDDGCSTCDADSNGYIDEMESWNDPDLIALGGYAHIDADGDCAENAGHAQPSHPVDELDVPTTNCAAVPYSEAPNIIVYSVAADQDCDGLVDGVERAWGSNPQMADSDSDGAPDFVEMFQQTNPLNPDTDGDGYKDAPVPTYLNSNTAYDNCPGVANADQANNDGKRRDNGDGITGLWASNPNQDKMGDACDPDDDNDAAPDTYEVATAGSDPTNIDSDGDTVNDGAEIVYKTDPMVGGTNKPGWTAAIQQKYYRGCHHNLPAAGTYGPYTNWDLEYDPTSDDVEMNVDGDATLCPTDIDSDNGTGTKADAPEQFEDKVEAYGFALGIANKDTDGDGCEDWIEIVDVNGNRSANIVDVLIFAQRGVGGGPATNSDPLLDVNKNASVNIVDVLLAAKNSGLLKVHATCASEG